jgi:hypothetical protein
MKEALRLWAPKTALANSADSGAKRKSDVSGKLAKVNFHKTRSEQHQVRYPSETLRQSGRRRLTGWANSRSRLLCALDVRSTKFSGGDRK